MRVLVTGATGFIGANVVEALKQRDHDVVGITSRPDVSKEGPWLQLDLLEPADGFKPVEDLAADCLIHCAWDATPGEYWTTSSNLDWVASSLRLVEAFRKGGGKRLIIAGTSAEYSWRGDEPLSESSTELAPDSLYGNCKNSLRQIVESWAETNKLSWAWARIFCPFGKGENEARLIPKTIRRLQNETTLPFDSGSLVRDFLSVEDLADAFVTLAESNVQGPINLASGQGTSIREIVTLLAERLESRNKVQFDVRDDPVGLPGEIIADVSRLKSELKWHPEKTLAERIAETCDALVQPRN